MKRTKNLFDLIHQRENMQSAFHKACRGKRDRPEVAAFAENLEWSLRDLGQQIQDGVIETGQSHQFLIHDPKARIITAPCFRERVLHHAIMNVCERHFERFLISDTFACRRGKGRIAALQRAQHFCRRWPFAIKLDIRKYFDSVPQLELQCRLERRFGDVRLLELFWKIIRSYSLTHAKQAEFGSDERTGLPIGSLTSQHFANFYLGWLDRFIKQKLRFHGYVRYMDDFAIWHDSRRQLTESATSCAQFLHDELGLELKAKDVPVRVSSGVQMLGCRVFPDHLKLSRRSRRRYRRKLVELQWQFDRELIDELEFQHRSEALLAFTKAANVQSWKFRSSVLTYGRWMANGHGSG